MIPAPAVAAKNTSAAASTEHLHVPETSFHPPQEEAFSLSLAELEATHAYDQSSQKLATAFSKWETLSEQIEKLKTEFEV